MIQLLEYEPHKATATVYQHRRGHYTRKGNFLMLPHDTPTSTNQENNSQPAKPTLSESFWAKVEIGAPDECWIWKAGVTQQGYGQLRYGQKVYTAHRLSWVIHFGEIPSGMYVCHSCDRRPCANPHHLFIGTDLDNIADMVAKGRNPKGEDFRNSLLTDDLVREMRRKALAGVKLEAMAVEYGVTASCVYSAVRGENWKHITDVPPVALKNRRWSEEEDSVLRDMVSCGYSRVQISDFLNRTVRAIESRLQKTDDNHG
jgi:hypothetical protein